MFHSELEVTEALSHNGTRENVGDLAHGPIMATLREASKYVLDFLAPIVADNQHAADCGLTVIDIAAGENGNDSKNRLNVYVTDVDMDAANALLERVRIMARISGRIALGSVEADADALDNLAAQAATDALKLRTLDASLWHVFCESEKQILSGVENAHTDRDGTAHTHSLKGHTATIRYSDTAQARTRDNRPDHAYVEPAGYLSERDIADLMSA